VYPQEPENNNYVFHGVGTALTDGSYGDYGGVVYSYNQTHTLLWIPSVDFQQKNMTDMGNSPSLPDTQQGYLAYVGGVWITNKEQNVASSSAKISIKIINLFGMYV
jgi:uncharacterized lipoprotein YddW (UPF0748 family)